MYKKKPEESNNSIANGSRSCHHRNEDLNKQLMQQCYL